MNLKIPAYLRVRADLPPETSKATAASHLALWGNQAVFLRLITSGLFAQSIQFGVIGIPYDWPTKNLAGQSIRSRIESLVFDQAATLIRFGKAFACFGILTSSTP